MLAAVSEVALRKLKVITSPGTTATECVVSLHVVAAAAGLHVIAVLLPFLRTYKMLPPVPRNAADEKTRRLASVPAVVMTWRAVAVVPPEQAAPFRKVVSALPTVPVQNPETR